MLRASFGTIVAIWLLNSFEISVGSIIDTSFTFSFYGLTRKYRGLVWNCVGFVVYSRQLSTCITEISNLNFSRSAYQEMQGTYLSYLLFVFGACVEAITNGSCDLETRCLNDAISCLSGRSVSNHTQGILEYNRPLSMY
ncbi:hypothetical protein P5673_013376 [Acropora cervicornis]|uniref:Uncharacterized protein n=1 Tax=Acropora cervicornis TaxID=6130 RepID=A0AAD9QLW5_ACRCE|nr:hypothetical protein P5673_013376 [Acropora cervicornis]